ncbi:hypothetical protein Ahy_B03g067430 isoform A [Arachis hypogaea]|uniref:Uncharacterized protein n=1 Tax=Arachis hypogaea TaxID=3818 RepID=A0A445A6S9_ARAHY|nr:hypothetical protein Ahy_B03g067430 isoform A [Arachis hypogaea]
MDAIRSTYKHCIRPVNSEEYWCPTDAPRCEPLPVKRPAHHPEMKRKIDPVEGESTPTKLGRHLNKCQETEHYYKTCKNPSKDPNRTPMTKKERSQNIAQVSTDSFNLNQPPPPPQLNQTQRMKYLVVRPSCSPASGLSMVIQSTPPTMDFRPCLTLNQDMHPKTATTNVLPKQRQNDISAKTMAATSSETTSRLFKFILTPGFKPPRKR